MVVKLRKNAQITIPKDIVTKLGLSTGDKMDIVEKGGTIYMVPTVAYPKSYLNELKNELEDTKEKIASGEQSVFDDIDTLFDSFKIKQ